MAVRLTLDKLMKSKNLSRYEVAKRTGVSYQIINKYYKNKVVRYDSYVLDRICTCLDCEISDLIVNDNNAPSDKDGENL